MCVSLCVYVCVCLCVWCIHMHMSMYAQPVFSYMYFSDLSFNTDSCQCTPSGRVVLLCVAVTQPCLCTRQGSCRVIYTRNPHPQYTSRLHTYHTSRLHSYHTSRPHPHHISRSHPNHTSRQHLYHTSRPHMCFTTPPHFFHVAIDPTSVQL